MDDFGPEIGERQDDEGDSVLQPIDSGVTPSAGDRFDFSRDEPDEPVADRGPPTRLEPMSRPGAEVVLETPVAEGPVQTSLHINDPLEARANRYVGDHGIDTGLILQERPDVFRAFFTEYYGGGNDRHSSAWIDRVGGMTPEDYAAYWFTHHGSPSGGRMTADGVDIAQILNDRPDVFRAFYTEYYGPNNDHRSSAWNDRVGGATPEDYANYWYVRYGKAQGYAPASHGAAPTADPDARPEPPQPGAHPPGEDPSLDPWNHPSIYPDAVAPDEGMIAQVGQRLGGVDPTGLG